MKSLLALVATLAVITAHAQDTNLPPMRICMTNLVMMSTPGNSMRTYYGTNQETTTISGIGYLSSSCDMNDPGVSPITFSTFNGCSPKASTVAWIAWTCNSSATCPGGLQGQSTPCGGGGSLSVTMPDNCVQISYILTSYGDDCCSLRLCEVPNSRTICTPPVPAPPGNE
jgi:hypothetical protein